MALQKNRNRNISATKIKTILVFLILLPVLYISTGFAQIEPLIPLSVSQNEKELLQTAQEVEPEILAGGYRQYDLVVARLSTWNEGVKDILVRLILPPAKNDTPYPLIAYIHGGGFIGGTPKIDIHENRERFGYAMRSLLDNGFAIASVGYRLAREAGWPAPISDVLCGLRFLFLHADYWGVDAHSIGISGHSAGSRIAVLAATIDQNLFYQQNLPWGNATVQFSAIWLWAGSAWDWPVVSQWVEYGKPRNYSVPRLLFGEHPAWDISARHRVRIRSHLPHLSMALPPIYLIRGASDYGGDHTDAQRAIQVWKALGSEATLGISPGGHSTIGPIEPLIDFFTRHSKKENQRPKERNLIETARRLNDIEEPLAAVEVLVQKNTTKDGHVIPEGQWIILHNEALMWNPSAETWSEKEQYELKRAQKMLARYEAEAAAMLLERGEWFRASVAADNVLSLGIDSEEMIAVALKAENKARHEEMVFDFLQQANKALRSGNRHKAFDIITGIHDDRLKVASERVRQTEKPGTIGSFNNEIGQSISIPPWADNSGTDFYGVWISVNLGNGTDLRLRWVKPGLFNLPNHLHYRNRTNDPWTTKIAVQHGFWLAETPTTVEQWHAVLDQKIDDSEQTRKPKTMINYLEIVEWLKVLEQRKIGLIARLPGEDEWLFAATLGGEENVQPPTNIAAVHALNIDVHNAGPLPVDTTMPNLGGYYGFLGGVMEWTGSPGAAQARITNQSGHDRIIAYPVARGGAWSNMPHSLYFGLRMQQRHSNRQPDLGFRIAIGGGPDAQYWLRKVKQ